VFLRYDLYTQGDWKAVEFFSGGKIFYACALMVYEAATSQFPRPN